MDNIEDKMVRTWYLIIKGFVFICVVMGIYFITHFTLGVPEGIEYFKDVFFESLFLKSAIAFVPSFIIYLVSLLFEKLLHVKYKIAKKIRIIEPIIYLILSIVFTLGFMYNSF